MRFSVLVPALYLAVSSSAQTAPAPFLAKLKAQITSAASPTTVTLSGSATYIQGSTKETGTAQLQANADGSAIGSLALESASRGESFGSWNNNRLCSWTDAKTNQHVIVGATCLVPVIWFAPSMVEPGRLTENITIQDDGELPFLGSTLHRLTYLTAFPSDDPNAKTFQDWSKVHLYYDPLSLRITALDYLLHPDGNDAVSIPATVIFSDYRPVGAFILPYRIDRYVNGVLELSVQANTVTAN